MSDQLRAGLVRVLSPDGDIAGVGFAVSDPTLIVTCAHNLFPKGAVRGAPPGVVNVQIEASGEVLRCRLDPLEFARTEPKDIALLRFEGSPPSGLQPLPIGRSEGTSEHGFLTFGARRRTILRGAGVIRGPVTDGNGERLLQLLSSEVSVGFSGAPVWDESSRRVVGIVGWIVPPDSYNRQDNTALAIPCETLQEVCPELIFREDCPYRGLEPLSAADRHVFFGRETVVAQLLDILRSQPRLVTIVGPSGSGKSSLLQAGLLSQLQDLGVTESHALLLRPGPDAIAVLQDAVAARGVPFIDASLPSEAGTLPFARTNYILLDQFEEIFTVCTPSERAELFSALRAAIDSEECLSIILAIRSEFFDGLHESPLGEYVEESLFYLLRMGYRELRVAITGPAQRVGVRFEDGIDEVVADELSRLEHPLPVLAVVMMELWKRRSESGISAAAYMSIGGIAGAVGAWADAIVNRLSSDECGVARRIITRLIHYGEAGVPDTRWRFPAAEIPALMARTSQAERVRDALIASRLLTSDVSDGVVTLELVHDSLLREWARLRRWVEEDREFLVWRQALERRADTWNRGSRSAAHLLPKPDLPVALHWLRIRPEDLSETGLRYIRATQEGHRRSGRILFLGSLGGAITVLLILAAGIASLRDLQKRAAHGEALRLANLAAELRRNDPTGSGMFRSMLLAVESLRAAPTPEGVEIAQRLLVGLPEPGATLLPYQVPRNPRGRSAPVSRSLGMSADGRWIVTGAPGFVHLWDRTSARETFRAPQRGHVKVAISGNGSLFAAADDDGVVSLWEVETGRQVRSFRYADSIRALAFSDDGRFLAAGGGVGLARVWNVETGVEMPRLELPPDREMYTYYDDLLIVYDLDLSPDGRFLAVGGNGHGTGVWEVATGRSWGKLPHSGEGPTIGGTFVFSVDFSGDGKWLAAGAEHGVVRIWAIDSEKPDNGPTVVAASPAYGSEIGGGVSAVALSYDGNSMLTGHVDGTLRVWALRLSPENWGGEVSLVSRTEAGAKVEDLAMDWQGSTAIVGTDSSRSRLWSIPLISGQTIVEESRLSSRAHIEALVNSPNRERFAIVAARNTIPGGYVFVRNTQDWTAIGNPIEISTAPLISFSLDNRRIALGADGRLSSYPYDDSLKTVLVRNLERGTVTSRFRYSGELLSLAPTTSDGWVAVSQERSAFAVWHWPSSDSAVRIRDPGAGSFLGWAQAPVAFSTDGLALLVAGKDSVVRVWRIADASKLASLPDRALVQRIVVDAAGKWVATASAEGVVRVWRAGSWTRVSELLHTAGILDLAFNSDGEVLVTSTEDRYLNLWDPSTGRILARFQLPQRAEHVVLSKDGGSLLVFVDGEWMSVYRWRAKDLADELCRRVLRDLTPSEWRRYVGTRTRRDTCRLE